MVTVEALEVRCTACGAAVGESCTTIVGDVRTPHAPRAQGAASGLSPALHALRCRPRRTLPEGVGRDVYVSPPGQAEKRQEYGGYRMDDVNHIFMVNGKNRGLVKYCLAQTDGSTREFDDLEQAIEFAKINDVYEIGVVFPDGDVQSIPLFVRGGFELGSQTTNTNKD